MNIQQWWGYRSTQVHPTSTCNPYKSVVQYTKDSSTVEFVQEGYIGIREPIVDLKNDEVIASVLQEEMSQARITDESGSVGEVGKMIQQMNPIASGEAATDRQRLISRLELYDQDELKMQGDGNCQFRSLSDQLYRSPEYHKAVRRNVVDQLKAHPELYAPYIPMNYHEYLMKISRLREWGDHVTLQAAADWYGIRICVLTSYRDTCYIEILPHLQKSKRVIFLSFWAENVHYNSVYPKGELDKSRRHSSRKNKCWNWLKQLS